MELLSKQGLTATMATFLGSIGATYFAANVVSKKAEGPSKAPVAAGDPETKVAVQALLNQGVMLQESLKGVTQGVTYLVQSVQSNLEGR